MQDTRVQSLGLEDPLKRGMALHYGILAWRIPWTEVHDIVQEVVTKTIPMDMKQWTDSKLGKECQGYIVSPCLFNLYAEFIMWNAGLDEAQAGITIAGRNINNLRYADDTTLTA